jgi:predicted phosphodiesterase
MRIGVMSDVHANPPALRAVLADINAASPDAVVSCGDPYGPEV